MTAPPDNRNRLRESLAVIRQLQAEIERLSADREEPIAVLGMACRFPGGASTPEAYWALLCGGADAITEIPPHRWDVDRYYDPDSRAPGKACTRHGGFITDVDCFDAKFFAISPREAETLDPQHRLLLEVAWEALEQGALDPASLHNSQTGIFLGICSSDYANLAMQDLDVVDGYVGTGNAHSTAAGRLSFLLGCRGPSMAVDTACSSSLVSVHLACQSLRAGECDTALAGGVNLMLSPALTVNFSQAGMLAPDGRCKSFDARADGYARGEGCGMIVLKRLSDALAGEEPILAVIRGSAVNQDGKSSGLTVPNGPAQAAVIRQALRRARVAPAEVSFVEAHGTGTPLGDPIEIGALRNVYAEDRSREQPVIVGAVKSNIGHLEAAAGIAGLIKVVLCLQHGQIPGNLHFQKINPRIGLDGAPIVFPTSLRAWEGLAGRRIAGVSSFGFGGTNAHVILEQAPEQMAAQNTGPGDPHLLVLSAKTPAALDEACKRYIKALGDAGPIENVCHTTQAGRTHFDHRLAVTGRDAAELVPKLRAHVAREPAPWKQSGKRSAGASPRVAFLFAGQGSEYSGMARRLYERYRVFRDTVDRSGEVLAPILELPLRELLWPADDACDFLKQTRFAQPALFAIEVALAALWRSCGIRPSAVLGHGLGEFAAACVAGALDLEDGLKLTAERGRLMQAASPDAAMAAIFTDRETFDRHIEPFAGEISLAADNGPRHLVASGRRDVVHELLERISAEKIGHCCLNASTAFSSPCMKPIEGELLAAMRQMKFKGPTIPFISTVTGQMKSATIIGPDYWVRHVCAPTEFRRAMGELARLEIDAFLEIGPQPTLTAMGQACLPDSGATWLYSLARKDAGSHTMLHSLGTLYTLGASVDWRAVHDGRRVPKIALPTYPFDRKRHWLASRTRHENVAPLVPTEVETSSETMSENILYALEWQTGAPLAPPPMRQRGKGIWILLSEGSTLAEELAEQCARQGSDVLRVQDTGRFVDAGNGRLEISVELPEHHTAVIQAALQRRQVIEGIIYLWEGRASEALAPPVDGGVTGLLALVHAVLEAEVPCPISLVTRSALAVQPSDTSIDIAAAPLWGFGKCLALEQPALFGVAVDLGTTQEAEAARVFEEITSVERDRFVALRSHHRMIARLRPLSLPKAASPQVRPEGLYVIAGGTGSLGLHVAEWLVARGARHLALLSRRGAATTAAREAIDRWRAVGVLIDIHRVDIADAGQMRTLKQTLYDGDPSLAGVVHVAGEALVEDLETLDVTALRSLLGPKLIGGWLLHELAADSKLDFFVCFSSIASVWGGKGLGAYAAANQCLDSLAQYRRKLGLPGLSINWGPWEHSNLVDDSARAVLDRVGIRSLPASLAVTALEALIGAGSTGVSIGQATVARVDWGRFAALYAASAPSGLFDLVASAATPVQVSDEVRSKLLDRLRRAPPAERLQMLSRLVQEHVAHILRYDAGELPDPRAGFFDLGMDSLMNLELRNTLTTALGTSLAATIAFDFPRAESLASHILDQLFAAPASSSRTEDRVSMIGDSTSDEQIATRLANRIRSVMRVER